MIIKHNKYRLDEKVTLQIATYTLDDFEFVGCRFIFKVISHELKMKHLPIVP